MNKKSKGGVANKYVKGWAFDSTAGTVDISSLKNKYLPYLSLQVECQKQLFT